MITFLHWYSIKIGNSVWDLIFMIVEDLLLASATLSAEIAES